MDENLWKRAPVFCSSTILVFSVQLSMVCQETVCGVTCSILKRVTKKIPRLLWAHYPQRTEKPCTQRHAKAFHRPQEDRPQRRRKTCLLVHSSIRENKHISNTAGIAAGLMSGSNVSKTTLLCQCMENSCVAKC